MVIVDNKEGVPSSDQPTVPQKEDLNNENNENNENNNNNNENKVEKIDLTLKLNFSTKLQYKTLRKGESKRILIMNSIDSPIYEPEKRAGLDLVIVVDVSGSMGDNMELMKNTLEFLITQLQGNDSLSLVTFESKVEVVFPSLKMSHDNKQTAVKEIKKLSARGSTNLSGGLLAGIDQVNIRLREIENHPSSVDKRIQSILLFTDGYANIGITDTPKIIEAITPLMQNLPDCSLYTFGYGKSHSDNLLRGLSDSTKNGMYYFVSDRDKIPETFVDCLGGLLSVLGQLVKLSVRPLNSAKFEELLSDNKHTIGEDGTCNLSLNDVFSEEHRDILFAITPPLCENTGELSIAECVFSYFNVTSNSIDTVTEVVSINVIETDVIEDSTVDLDVDAHFNEILTFRALESAKKVADKYLFEEAKKSLRDTKEQIENSASKDFVSSKDMIRNLDETIADMNNRQQYLESGSKKISAMSKLISKQKGSSAMSKKRDMRKQFEIQQMQYASKQLNKNDPGVVEFVYGNKHQLLSADEATPSKSDPNVMCAHRWTAFVECSTPVIEKVKFKLHFTFKEAPVIVDTHPFELTKNGWGIFSLPITVYLKQDPVLNPSGKDKVKLIHNLDFSSDLTEDSLLVKL